MDKRPLPAMGWRERLEMVCLLGILERSLLPELPIQQRCLRDPTGTSIIEDVLFWTVLPLVHGLADRRVDTNVVGLLVHRPELRNSCERILDLAEQESPLVCPDSLTTCSGK